MHPLTTVVIIIKCLRALPLYIWLTLINRDYGLPIKNSQKERIASLVWRSKNQHVRRFIVFFLTGQFCQSDVFIFGVRTL